MTNCYVAIYGNLLVDGSLTLLNVTLSFRASSNNEYRAEVRGGGVLSATTSVVTPLRQSFGIGMLALPGSALTFQGGSIARWLYGVPGSLAPGGLQVYTSTVVIDRVILLVGQSHGLYVGPGVDAGTIRDSDFVSNRGGAGVFLDAGASATLQANAMVANRFGVLAVRSSPALASNTMSQNAYGLVFSGASSTTVTDAETIASNAIAGVWIQYTGASGPAPSLVGARVEHSARFGVYALWTNLTMTGSTVRQSRGVGVYADRALPSVRPNVEGTTFPWTPPYMEYAVAVYGATGAAVRGNGFPPGRYGLSAVDASVAAEGNTWSGSEHSVVALRSTVDLAGGTYDPLGSVVFAVHGIASTVSSTNDTFLPGPNFASGVIGERGSYAAVDNASFVDVKNPVSLQDGSWGLVKSSRAARTVATLCCTGIFVGDGDPARPTTVLRTNLSNYFDGIYVLNATALVERTNLTGRYYGPGYPFFSGELESAHISVFGGANVTVDDSDFVYGVYGVSVESGGPTVPSRATVTGSRFYRPGYRGVNSGGLPARPDVNRLDVAGNAVYDASLLAIQTTTAGRATIRNNTVRGFDGTGILVAQNDLGAPGDIAVEGNAIAYGNATGILVRGVQRALVRDNDVSHVVGDLVAAYGEGITVQTSPAAGETRIEGNAVHHNYLGIWPKMGRTNLTGNRVENNTMWGIYLGELLGPSEPDVHDNNTVANNAVGVWIDGAAVDPSKVRLWWNDVRDNGVGVYVDGPDPGPGNYFHAECNWWNHDSGPLDDSLGPPDYNPLGQGQPVSDYFWYRELNPPPPPYVPKGWLNRTSSDPLAACSGGV